MSTVLVLLVAGPGAIGVLFMAAGHRADRFAATAGLLTAAGAAVLGTAAAVARPAAALPFLAGLPLELRVDGLTALLLVPLVAVTMQVAWASGPEAEGSPARYFGLLLLFLSGVLATLTAASLLPLLMGWEVMGAASYALIGFWWRESRNAESALTAFLTTRAADLGLYAAAGACMAGSGSLSLTALPDLPAGWRTVAAVGLVLAAAGKSAQLPFSFWLARAMDGPSPVSALLHSAAMVAMGGYLLLRVHPLLTATKGAGPAVAWLGAATAVLLGVVALAQSDLKLLLAASTASQLGVVVLAAGVGSVAGGARHLVAHAFVKSTLFLVAGVWLAALGSRQLTDLCGAARRHQLVGAAFVLGAAALAGLPPLSLWLTKDGVLAAAAEQSTPLYAAGLLAAVLAAAYAGRAVGYVVRPVPADVPPAAGLRPMTWAPILQLAVLAAVGGLLAVPPLSGRVDHLLGTTQCIAGGARAGAVRPAGRRRLHARRPIRRIRARRLPRLAARWGGLEALAHAIVVRPVVATAGLLARFDDRILARGVALAPRGATGLARQAERLETRLHLATLATGPRSLRAAAVGRAVDERGVGGLVTAVGRAAPALARKAVRSQTGAVHQYLAQAAVALAVATLLLLVVR